MLKVTERLKLIKTSIPLLRLAETVKAILVLVFSYRPERDRSFDKRYKTDTTGIVKRDDLGICDERTKQAAVYYVSAPVKFYSHILRTLEINYQNFDFIDMGCGKGRVLMLASDWPFRSITGVEISPQLAVIAEKNLQIYPSTRGKCPKVQVLCMDARLFPIGNENSVFHFYHPFDVQILRPILESIASRFRGSGKRVLVVYIWEQLPKLFPLFDELHFERLRYVQSLNQRYQYAVFTL